MYGVSKVEEELGRGRDGCVASANQHGFPRFPSRRFLVIRQSYTIELGIEPVFASLSVQKQVRPETASSGRLAVSAGSISRANRGLVDNRRQSTSCPHGDYFGRKHPRGCAESVSPGSTECLTCSLR